MQLTALVGLIALHRPARRIGLAGVAVGVVALIANASQGGTATGLIVLAAVIMALLHRKARRRWPAVVVSLVICGAAVAALMSWARRTVWPDWALTALSPVRHDMWNAAWAAFRRAETFGFGPGGYAQVNPWASDADHPVSAFAPHPGCGRTRWCGLILLTLLFLCGLAWASLAHTSQAAWITIAAWTALSAHAFMDHLLEFWPIPLAAGLVLGYGLVAKTHPEPKDQPV